MVYRIGESPRAAGASLEPRRQPRGGEMTAKRDQSVCAGAGERSTYPARYPNPRAESRVSIARYKTVTKQRSGHEGSTGCSHSRFRRCVVSSLLRTLARQSPQACGRVAARHAPAHATTPHRTRHTGRRRHSESSPSTEMRTGASLAPRRHYGGMCTSTCDTSTTVPPQLWIDVI